MTRNSNMPSDVTTGSTSRTGSAVVLRHADRELVLLPGKYLIGRSRRCHLVINDEVVSRRHAELEVGLDGGVVLRDLSSHNGIVVNQKTVTQSSTRLSDGDTFLIGADSFRIFVSDDALESATMKIVEVVTDTASTIVKQSAKAMIDETRPTHDLDLVASVADCAILDGQFAEAERVLAQHLRGILADIRGLRQTGQAIRDKAYKYSLRLAEVTHKAEWFDLAVDLMFIQAIVCSEQQVEELLRVRKLLTNLDTHRLEQYAQLVRHKGQAIQNQRVASLLDAMVKLSKGG